MRKVFLDDLPRWKSGRYEGKFNWKESVGIKVKFIYDEIKDEVNRIAKMNGDRLKKRLSVPILIFKDGVLLGRFDSASELERKSKELFGVKLNHCLMGYVAQGKQKTHKGFTFKYVD